MEIQDKILVMLINKKWINLDKTATIVMHIKIRNTNSLLILVVIKGMKLNIRIDLLIIKVQLTNKWIKIWEIDKVVTTHNNNSLYPNPIDKIQNKSRS